MNRGDTLRPKGEKDVAGAATKVIIEASRDDIWSVLRAAGVEPERLAEQSRKVARDVLARFAEHCEETTRSKDEENSLHEGLGMLVQLLRRRERLSTQDLAKQARVEADEIRRIEIDPNYSPNPRTIYQLEQMFNLPPRTLVRLAGSTTRHSAEFTDEVMRFAANAKAMGSLSNEEQKLVTAFVRFLVSQGDKGNK